MYMCHLILGRNRIQVEDGKTVMLKVKEVLCTYGNHFDIRGCGTDFPQSFSVLQK